MFAQCVLAVVSAFVGYTAYVAVAVYELIMIQLSTRKGLLREKDSLRLSDDISLSVVIHTVVFIGFIVSLKNSQFVWPVEYDVLFWGYLAAEEALSRITFKVCAVIADILETVFIYGISSEATEYSKSTVLRILIETVGFLFIFRNCLISCAKRREWREEKEHRRIDAYEVLLKAFFYLYKRIGIFFLVRDKERSFLKSLFMIEISAEIEQIEYLYISIVLAQSMHARKIAEHFIRKRTERTIT